MYIAFSEKAVSKTLLFVFFEITVAFACSRYGLNLCATLATVFEVMVKIPIILCLVGIANKLEINFKIKIIFLLIFYIYFYVPDSIFTTG